MAVCWPVDAFGADTVLIRNVRLLDRNDESDGVRVNMLISGINLEIITRDELPADDAALVVDAQNGFLLGRLNIGAPSSFLIFDADPRKDVDVLLDTKVHARFVMRAGVILKNTLPESAASTLPTDSVRTRPAWLAYTPPPLALPMSYLDESKWNRWERKAVSGIFIAASLMDRQKWLSQDSASTKQIGDLSEFDAGEIRGLRFGSVGTINFDKPWVYTIFAASNAFSNGFDSDSDEGFSLLDYRLDIPVFSASTLSLGKQKEPISMQRLMSLTNTPMQERSSAADGMLRSRNFGAVLSGTVFNKRMSWAGGWFNDWADTGKSFEDSSEQYTGRITWLPFVSEDQSNLLHLGLGLRFTDAQAGLRYHVTPEFYTSPTFVDTGVFDADGAVTYSLEASWRKGPFWVDGEYIRTEVDSPTVGDPVFDGYHLSAAWVLSGEMRPYSVNNGTIGKVPVSGSVYQGGKGALELSVRWSALDLTDGLVDGGEMNILSLGVNWWLSPIFSTSINYRHIELDRYGDNGRSDGIDARITLILE